MSLWPTSKASDQVEKDAGELEDELSDGGKSRRRAGPMPPPIPWCSLLLMGVGIRIQEVEDLTGLVWGLWANPLLIQFAQLRRERGGQPSPPTQELEPHSKL